MALIGSVCGDEVIYCRLLAMIKELPPLPQPCSNCQNSPCISGAEVISVNQVRLRKCPD